MNYAVWAQTNVQWPLRLRILPLFPFLVGLALAQQAPPQHDSIVVTGTYEPLSLDEIDRAIQVLPARENALMLNTLVDLLRLDPSLDLQERAPDGVQADLSIRGSSFEQTLVLLNGQRLNDVQSGHHDMDIPVPLRGGVARRGDGRLRLHPVRLGRFGRRHQHHHRAAAGLRRTPAHWPCGSFGTDEQSASISDTFGAVSEQLSFARDFSSGFMPDRDYRNLQFASTTDAKTSLGASRSHPRLHGPPLRRRPVLRPYPSWEDTKTWFAGVRQAFGEDTDVDFAYRRHSDLFVLNRDDPAIYTNHHVDESYRRPCAAASNSSPPSICYYGVEALHENHRQQQPGRFTRAAAGRRMRRWISARSSGSR